MIPTVFVCFDNEREREEDDDDDRRHRTKDQPWNENCSTNSDLV
jgi:hypothetical protein